MSRERAPLGVYIPGEGLITPTGKFVPEPVLRAVLAGLADLIDAWNQLPPETQQKIRALHHRRR